VCCQSLEQQNKQKKIGNDNHKQPIIEDDNAGGVGYDLPDDIRHLDLGFLIPFPSGSDPDEFPLFTALMAFV